jgi:uncharacterized protein (DUF885 family)
MQNDIQFKPFRSDSAVLNAYHTIYNTVMPFVDSCFGSMPKSKFEIRKTEDFRAASASAQYFVGNLQANRPGIFYVPILEPVEVNMNNTEMESLFLHEAIPGHHFQMSIQSENTSLPLFRQKYWNNAYGEGWALYTESLGKMLGLYTDPYQELGALVSEMHRAIRLVLDAGLHTGKMTRETAITYMMEHERISEASAIAEVERYMAIPAQAISYKIGQIKISQLREKYQLQMGHKFSLTSFHDAVLNKGTMPLPVLETYLDNWAEQK